ncbi:MAG: glycosyltransferase [Bacteroidia bacterium]|nr:glycosyltransferase [Bacteroidia bacterium]
MRILHVSTLDWGGAANAAVRLHKGLLKQGVDSRFLSLRKNNPDIPQSFAYYDSTFSSPLMQKGMDYAERAYNKLNSLQLRNRPEHFEVFTLTNQFSNLLRNPHYQQADIINLHWVGRFMDYPRFFRENKKPVVWTMHDMEPFTGGNHYEVEFPFDGYKDLIAKQEKMKLNAMRGHNLTVVGPSKWLMNRAKESKVFGPFPHFNIPYGMDTSLFSEIDQREAKEAFGIPTDKPALVFVAEVITNRRKGFHLLKEALTMLGDADITLCAVGKADDSLKSIRNFHHLGVIKDERKMAMAYAAADAFVIPSVEDNLPNTVLESICTGTPVIGFPIGGVPDMVRQGENGIICKEVSAEALAAGIRDFLAQRQLFDRNAISLDAHRRYDESVQATRYLELYQSLLIPEKIKA